MAIYNWYHGTPVDSSPAPAPAPTPDPVVSSGVAAPPQNQIDSGRPDGRPVDIHKFSRAVVGADGKYKRQFTIVDDLSSVKHASLKDYLTAEQLGDRSGYFSGVDFGIPFDSTKARAGEMISGMAGLAGALVFSPVMSAASAQAIQDPTGLGNRYIPNSGVGNLFASMAIDDEFKNIYEIKQYRQNASNQGKDGGFVMNVGGINIYRQPGKAGYRGQLDRIGLDQQGARQLEIFGKGVSHGTKVANALLAGGEVTQEMIDEIGSDRVVLETINGGYLLNGNFHYGTGTAGGGYMEDLDGLAMSMFSANGQLNLSQAKVFASSWRQSASSMGRGASTQELLSNLRAFQQQSSKYAIALSMQKTEEEQEATNTSISAAQEKAGRASEKTAKQIAEEAAERARQRQQGEETPPSGKPTEYTLDTGFEDRTDFDGSSGPFAEGGEIPESDSDNFITGNELIEAQGDESGFVNRPPSEVTDEESVADDRPMVAKEEGMVLNAEAVKLAGEQDVAAMIKQADDYIRQNGEEVKEDREATDIQISDGEVYISPRHADVIGRSRLRKINDRGVPKTEKKLQKAAKGGFIGYAEGTDEGGVQLAMSMIPPGAGPEAGQLPDTFIDRPEVADAMRKNKEAGSYPEATFPDVKDETPVDFLDKLEGHWSQPVTRTRNVNFFKNLSDVELLTYMIMAETATSNADPQDMYAVAQTAVNRMNSTDPNMGFRNQNTLQKVLLKQRPKGAFEYEGMDKTRGSNMRSEYNDTYDIFAQGAARAYSIANDILSGEMESSPPIPENVMWYEAPTQSGESWMTRNLDFFDSYGGHNFYVARQ